ncbi:hypothetical protein M3201_09485 [Paenibacillus motobuensis]|uniref:hypothetical protein n=1 Tax=Paenibacillus TaxID=44249 RepID=UPI002040AEA9|nr:MULTISPECIES: hypothetical protein [Paenibacillus]MCM3039925.1 hypothetical protein [Paenibacillus lutimineralis]MCM3647029.1 hypothetical protein [Paenibacillus motobuensis]
MLKQLGLFANSRIIIAFFIPACSIAATYTVYTYLTPILQDVIAVPIGGKLAASNGISKLRFVFLAQAIILASLYLSSRSLMAGLISISLIALLVYTMNSTMQLYFIDLADRHSPTAREFASSLTPCLSM